MACPRVGSIYTTRGLSTLSVLTIRAMRRPRCVGWAAENPAHFRLVIIENRKQKKYSETGILSDTKDRVQVYKITWDKQTGGVLLNTSNADGALGVSPRPVFFEELDLIGLDKLGWEYPHCKEPIMWAVNKQYWYFGQHLFDVKGANIYTSPTVILCEGITPEKLKAVNVTAMLKKCSDLMFVLENEAIEFIRDTYTAYTKVNKTFDKSESNQLDYEAMASHVEQKTKQKMAVVKQDCDSFDIMPLEAAQHEGKRVLLSTKIDRFIASFSGGKDSQVVLDLCTRAIPPTAFEVIYSDTGYEIPSSLTLYDSIQKYYKKKFPGLKFETARNHEQVLNYWDKIGTPSDNHRWCCSVMKTVPLYRKLQQGSDKQLKFLAFEGVRAEESVKRNDYNRIGKGVKHRFVINARPILRWNTTEVFLYLFRHNLEINEAYRVGKPRVGCVLCPFGSPWDDMIVNTCYHDKLEPFLSKIEQIADERKIPNKTEYISDRKWKLRGSGALTSNTTSISLSSTPTKWEAKVKDASKDIFLWLPTLGKYSVKRNKNHVSGELLFEKEVYQFEILYGENENDFRFILHDNNNAQLRYLVRRVINKTAYCINCESCELECAYGALSVYPEVKVDTARCVHCHKCLEYHNVGCIVADSLLKPNEVKLTNMKISKYGTFGMHEDWVDQYLMDSENFWKDNLLGKKQIPSFKAWLKDAEIIDDKANFAPFGKLCKELNEDNPNLMWELIYVNLVYNSPMIKWYVASTSFDTEISRKTLDKMALDYFQSNFKATTITYAVQALVQTLKYSPIGTQFTQFELVDPKGTSFMRKSYRDLSPEALAYSLYKYAYERKLSMFRVSDLYRLEEENGPYKEFGIDKAEMLKKLRYLTTEKNRVLIAELTMGLDHITLREDLTPLSAIKLLLA